MNETKHLIDDYEDQENFYLLTNLDAVTMETTVRNTVQSLIGQSSVFEDDASLVICFAANELRFAEYCDFHACRKRERKSDYQRTGYSEIPGSRDSYFRCEAI